MIVYVPTYYDECNCAPSWMGNYCYPTVTIRGIFDSAEKAERAIENWRYKQECRVEVRELDITEDEKIEGMEINYDSHVLEIIIGNYCDYELNKEYDEPYSAVYDKEGYLGVSDY